MEGHTPWLVVFDFDRSLLDWTDTDVYIFEKLAPHMIDEAKGLWKTKQYSSWNRLIDDMLGKLFESGITKDKILETYQGCLLSDSAVKCLEFLQLKGCYVTIASDSNTFYISTVLEVSHASDLIDFIATNPASWSPEGRLQLGPYQTEPHGCTLCSANMCKGYIVDRLRKDKKFRGTIYVGDGNNDYCPSMRLKKTDFVFAKRDTVLEKKLSDSDPEATIKAWTDSTEFFQLFKEVLID